MIFTNFPKNKLYQKKRRELISLAIERNLLITGTRSDLAERIFCYHNGFNEERNRYLYLFLAEGFVKIRISCDPIRREKELKKKHDGIITHIIPNSNLADEAKVHSLFKYWNHKGEWFYPHSQIIDFFL